jgi:hypothetical protein|uniref:Phosphoinositide phospholipase C n=1 Tax=Eutreptiella gymnastica TaxID=73025 RepID=A0A7S4LBY0_9EUGL
MQKIKSMLCCGKGAADVKEGANAPAGKLGGVPTTHVPVAKAHPDWLDKPVKDFEVICSHNSYLHGLQIMAGASTDGLKLALDKGARCIELDVYAKHLHAEEWEPMVTHGSVMKGYHVKVTGSVSFDDCLKFIADNGWKDTDDPLFLMIENVTDSAAETGNRMTEIVKKHIPEHRLMPHCSNIENTPLKDLLGKLIIVNGRDSGGSWSDFWTITAEGDMQNLNANEGPDAVDKNRICRIYPAADAGGFLSKNKDPTPFLGKTTFLAMNMQTDDDGLVTYLKHFGDCSFKLKA